jgi:hypothetical protein
MTPTEGTIMTITPATQRAAHYFATAVKLYSLAPAYVEGTPEGDENVAIGILVFDLCDVMARCESPYLGTDSNKILGMVLQAVKSEREFAA